jgi:hypothetical protein
MYGPLGLAWLQRQADIAEQLIQPRRQPPPTHRQPAVQAAPQPAPHGTALASASCTSPLNQLHPARAPAPGPGRARGCPSRAACRHRPRAFARGRRPARSTGPAVAAPRAGPARRSSPAPAAPSARRRPCARRGNCRRPGSPCIGRPRVAPAAFVAWSAALVIPPLASRCPAPDRPPPATSPRASLVEPATAARPVPARWPPASRPAPHPSTPAAPTPASPADHPPGTAGTRAAPSLADSPGPGRAPCTQHAPTNRAGREDRHTRRRGHPQLAVICRAVCRRRFMSVLLPWWAVRTLRPGGPISRVRSRPCTHTRWAQGAHHGASTVPGRSPCRCAPTVCRQLP